jgi:hypothetical protein
MASLCPFEEVQELLDQFCDRFEEAIKSKGLDSDQPKDCPWSILPPSFAEVDNIERAMARIIVMGEEAFVAPNTGQIDPLAKTTQEIEEIEEWKVWARKKVELWKHDLEGDWWRRACDAYAEPPPGWEFTRTRVGTPERNAQASDTAADNVGDEWVLVGV